MNYSDISKKSVITEVSLVPDAPCEECQINYPETEPEETCAECQINYPETEPEATKEVFGVVSDCAALNIREDCSTNAKVVAVVKRGAVLEIDSANCEDDWLAVYTESGVEGFCMAQYVTIKD